MNKRSSDSHKHSSIIPKTEGDFLFAIDCGGGVGGGEAGATCNGLDRVSGEDKDMETVVASTCELSREERTLGEGSASITHLEKGAGSEV
ncbi:uncharacterized protein LOC119579352 [Penaeus monodon]|uniref:uncharacterized protein LOC119579352 n=1 Tax=Penaeus monodon TaxID=6687 RepID=UPI0018A70AA7|nr:uncharacterized protein LOC119579352 [Penaeus monodon]